MNTGLAFDVVIIGGGAAGIMSAISCKKHHPEFSVALLDRTFALGRKILVCGAGRCNLTNINLGKDIEHHFYGAETTFVSAIFAQFAYQDIRRYFEDDLGIPLYVERKTDIGKVFPETNQAKTITSLLEDELQRLGVSVHLNTGCKAIEVKAEGFELHSEQVSREGTKPGAKFQARYLILAAGGMTYPALGANGSGYNLARKLGHTIIEPVPSALPLVGKNRLSQELQGTRIDAEVTSFIDKHKVKVSTDEIMLTQYGLSGPAVLNVSREISIQINREHKKNTAVALNFFPGKSYSEAVELLEHRWQLRPDQTVEKSLFGIFPNKFATIFLEIAGIDRSKRVSDLSVSEKELLCSKLTKYLITVTATRGWNEAEFTAGGIDTHEVKQGSLESIKVPHLYFCGEVLNVDGDVGGYNLSWAWSSGYVAGKLS